MSDINISKFKGFKSVDKNLSLKEVVELIRSGEDNLRQQVESARRHLVDGDKETYDRIKKSLSAVTFAGTFKDTRKNENLGDYSGLIVLDLDHVEQGLAELKAEVTGDPHTMLCFVSPSASGMKIVVKVDSDADYHTLAFQQVLDHYHKKYGIEIDPSGKDLARLCFLSFDPEVYFNPDSQVFDVEISMTELINSGDHLRLFSRAVEMTEAKLEFREGNRNEFVFELAKISNRYGIPKELSEGLIVKAYGYNEKEVLSTIRSAYRRTNEHGKGEAKESRAGDLMAVERYLNEHYHFRMNVVTGVLEYSRREDGSFQSITDFVENSILRELKLKGMSISQSNLASLLRSDFSSLHDPFKRYFESLPAWDGKDHLAMLMDTVKETNSEYWRWIFPKWISAMVASLLNDKVVNHTVLIIVGGQGIGKTTWIEHLVPPELKGYIYSGTVNTSNKDTLGNLAECMLINMDELENFNKTEIGELKQLITRSSVRLRKAYGRNNESLVRRASFAGSVNYPNFLNDPTGSRRFLVCTAGDIDLQALKRIDTQQVYAQVIALHDEGFQYWFDKDEVKRVTAENKQYDALSMEEELIKLWIEPAREDENVQFLSAGQICEELTKVSLYPLRQNSSVTVGKILRKLGYERVSRGNRYGYFVRIRLPYEIEREKQGLPGKAVLCIGPEETQEEPAF